jgi:hypothetical protein
VPETLAVGKTEHGFYATAAAGEPELGFLTTAAISFPVPLAAVVSPEHAVYVTTKGEQLTAEGASVTGVCTGTVNAPTAPSGHLCVYAGVEALALESYHGIENRLASPGTQKVGALLAFEVTVVGTGAAIKVAGTWAVTG